MRVADLIEYLEGVDPDARVLLMTQQSWAFENAVIGVCQRRDILALDAPGHDDEEVEPGDDDEAEADPGGWNTHQAQLPSNDVFLVEGEQLRYGDSRAWEVI